MSRVPASYVTMTAVITAEEEFDPHNVHSDGAVVTMVAVVSAVEARGYADDFVVVTEAQVESTDIYGHVDAATVTMVGVVSGVDVKAP